VGGRFTIFTSARPRSKGFAITTAANCFAAGRSRRRDPRALARVREADLAPVQYYRRLGFCRQSDADKSFEEVKQRNVRELGQGSAECGKEMAIQLRQRQANSKRCTARARWFTKF